MSTWFLLMLFLLHCLHNNTGNLFFTGQLHFMKLSHNIGKGEIFITMIVDYIDVW